MIPVSQVMWGKDITAGKTITTNLRKNNTLNNKNISVFPGLGVRPWKQKKGQGTPAPAATLRPRRGRDRSTRGLHGPDAFGDRLQVAEEGVRTVVAGATPRALNGRCWGVRVASEVLRSKVCVSERSWVNQGELNSSGMGFRGARFFPGPGSSKCQGFRRPTGPADGFCP